MEGESVDLVRRFVVLSPPSAQPEISPCRIIADRLSVACRAT